MIKVKTKMDRCLYVKIQNVKLRKIFNERPMHVALIVRKMTLFGKGKKLFIDVYVAIQKLNHKWTKE